MKKPPPVAYPSALSTALSHQLQHPVFIFSLKSEQTNDFVPFFSGLTKSLPCDLHIVNFKMLQNNIKREPSDSCALFLHRIGYDCRFRWRCDEKKVISLLFLFKVNYEQKFTTQKKCRKT